MGKLHHRLVRLIRHLGYMYASKRHGGWYRLNLYDDVWLQMDSWNRGIWLKRGDETITYLGMDFGGYECRDKIMLKWSLAHAQLFSLT